MENRFSNIGSLDLLSLYNNEINLFYIWFLYNIEESKEENYNYIIYCMKKIENLRIQNLKIIFDRGSKIIGKNPEQIK